MHAPMFAARNGLFVLCLLAGASAQTPTERLFDTWVAYRTGDLPEARYPGACELGDLNGDGFLDVVYARVGYVSQVPYPSPGIGVMLGDGTGSLSTPAVEYDALDTVQQLDGTTEYVEPVLADLDADGDLDAIVPLPGTFGSGNRIAVFYGRGNGTFDPVRLHNVGGSATGVAVADFDGDGDLDVAAAIYGNGQGNQVSILRNLGGRDFGTPSLFAAGSRPYKIAAGDLDADGDIDLAVTNQQSKITVLFNAGNATFPTTALHSGPSPASPTDFGSVRIGDVDNDGDLDVVFGNVFTTAPGNTGSAFGVFRNPGDGNLGSYEGQLMQFLSTAGLSLLELHDIDQDGWLDVLTLCFYNSTVAGWYYCRNDGAGGFLEADDFVGISAGYEPRGLAVGDMNGDGELDVVTSARASADIGVHLNPGDENFHVDTAFPSLTGINSIAVADIELDGDVDVAVTTSTDALVYTNDGTGNLTLSTVFDMLNSEQVEFFDLNGDPYLDIVYMFGGRAMVAINPGDGTFGTPVEYVLQVTDPGDTGAYDVDNDGDLDLCVTTRLIPFNRYISISLNNGDGTFAPDYLITVDLQPRPLAGADFNEDGNIDLITGHPNLTAPTAWLDVSLGNGDGTFQPFYRVTAGKNTTDFAAEDFDGDGHVDLATVSGLLIMHMGNGDGSFQPFVEYPTGGQQIFATDANGDGELDLAMNAFSAESVNLSLGRGDGTFDPADRKYGSIGPVTDMAVADLTGDGRKDLVAIGVVERAATSAGDGYVLVLEGEFCPGCPGAPETYCQGKINSNFCVPFMSHSGLPSVSSTEPFWIVGNDVIPNEFGILISGVNGRSSLPFHNATLCVKTPFTRVLPPKNSGSPGAGFCPGELRRNFNMTIQSGNDPALTVGREVHCQWIYRDPGVDAFNDGLTDGVRFTIDG